MAKKARRFAEEEPAFEFPTFDSKSFLDHEFEQSWATLIALVLAFVLAAVSFGLTRILSLTVPGVLEGAVPAAVGIVAIAASPLLVRRLRAAASGYTKGDWASLILIQLFGWIGLWFLLTDVLLR